MPFHFGPDGEMYYNGVLLRKGGDYDSCDNRVLNHQVLDYAAGSGGELPGSEVSEGTKGPVA